MLSPLSSPQQMPAARESRRVDGSSSTAAAASSSVSLIAGQSASSLPSTHSHSSSILLRSSDSNFFSPQSRLVNTHTHNSNSLTHVNERTMKWIRRFVAALKRRVALFIQALRAKTAQVRSLLLQRFPLLCKVPPTLLAQLCIKAQKKLFPRKHILLQQGQIAEFIYIVQMGSLAVYQQSEYVLVQSRGNETPAAAAAAAAASAASGNQRFESLHLADIAPGDEVGLYGLLRPSTILLIDGNGNENNITGSTSSLTKGKKKRRKKNGTGENYESSDSDTDGNNKRASGGGGKRKSGTSTSSTAGLSAYRSGFPQAHTVIASLPSIVYDVELYQRGCRIASETASHGMNDEMRSTVGLVLLIP